MTLLAARDLASFAPFAGAGTRFIAFSLAISNWRGAGETVPVRPEAFRLLTPGGGRHYPVLVGLDNRPGPGRYAAAMRAWPRSYSSCREPTGPPA